MHNAVIFSFPVTFFLPFFCSNSEWSKTYWFYWSFSFFCCKSSFFPYTHILLSFCACSIVLGHFKHYEWLFKFNSFYTNTLLVLSFCKLCSLLFLHVDHNAVFHSIRLAVYLHTTFHIDAFNNAHANVPTCSAQTTKDETAYTQVSNQAEDSPENRTNQPLRNGSYIAMSPVEAQKCWWRRLVESHLEDIYPPQPFLC